MLRLGKATKSGDSNVEVSEIDALAFPVLESLIKYHEGVKGREVEFEGYVRTGMVLERDKDWYVPKAEEGLVKYAELAKDLEGGGLKGRFPPMFTKQEKEVGLHVLYVCVLMNYYILLSEFVKTRL